ncbi:5-formyltetrahydrofolate cyclo-ligase [Thalassoroseus pseudoceratinae]|uniref:5-formyltetrahydrofolate cyclo-ligase n=1 Tax=Thalassoroseus pseudoceratinae TaxID=2713176 RepID=UPI00141EF11A|nr:5-formyltetrahydrofolate cyclo-ligase [Thalassoroseus pseudoceratinae]
MPDSSQRSLKSTLRKQIQTARAALPDRESRSRSIHDRWIQSELHRDSQAVVCYVNVRSEVATRDVINSLWQAEKRVAVPYCVERHLELTWITSWTDLTAGRFGILEPTPQLRTDPLRCPPIDELDVVLVPGVAFDFHGGRLGHGQGFYDRLLSRLPQRTMLVGVAFDCQIVSHVPAEPHDIPMHFILTESTLHDCRSDSIG